MEKLPIKVKNFKVYRVTDPSHTEFAKICKKHKTTWGIDPNFNKATYQDLFKKYCKDCVMYLFVDSKSLYHAVIMNDFLIVKDVNNNSVRPIVFDLFGMTETQLKEFMVKDLIV